MNFCCSGKQDGFDHSWDCDGPRCAWDDIILDIGRNIFYIDEDKNEFCNNDCLHNFKVWKTVQR